MLRAGAEAADDQCHHQHGEAGTGAGQQIADAGERGAERQDGRRAEPLGQQRGRDLEARHGAGKQAAQQAELRIAESELGLPDRQQHINEIGVAVVQCVRAAGDCRSTPLVTLGRGWPGDFSLRNCHREFLSCVLACVHER